MYKALAFNFRNQKIKFGLVNAGASEIIGRFNIPKFPFVLSIFGPVEGGEPGALQVRYLKRARLRKTTVRCPETEFSVLLLLLLLVRMTRSYLIPGH